MYSFFLLTFFIFGSFAEESDSSETKYIDLLPENEKKEFLNKIARRIFEEVQSKGEKHVASGEISDAQLDAHNEYVSKLLQEESKNLRKNTKKSAEDKKDQETSENRKETKVSSNEAKDKVDFTLREGKRSKRNKSYEETSKKDKVSNTISETNEDNKSQDKISVEIDVKNINGSKSNEDESSTVESELREDEIPVKVLYEDEATTNGKTEDEKRSIEITKQPKGVLRTRKYASRENDESATKIADFSPEESKGEDTVEAINEGTTTVKKIPPTLGTTVQIATEIVTVKDDQKLDEGITQRIYEAIDTEDSASDNVPADTNAKLSKDSSSYEETQGISMVATELDGKKDIKQDTINTSEGKEKNITQTDKPKRFKKLKKALRTEVKVNESKIDENKDASITTSKRNIEILTTANPNIESSSSVETSSKNPAEDVKPSSEVLTGKSGKSDLEAVKVSSEISTAKTDKTKLKPDTNKLEEVKEKKETLRHGFFENSAETQIEDNQLFQKLKAQYDDGKMKTYEVFEVKPDKSPFVNLPHKLTELVTEDPLQNEEHPYHVPVYNYAPKNAYFNPYNRLGPNIEDVDSEIDESFEKSSNLRVFYEPSKSYSNEAFIKQYDYGKKHKVHYSRYKPYKPMLQPRRPKYTDYNSKDYSYMDYYFGQISEGSRKNEKLNRKRKNRQRVKLVKEQQAETEKRKPRFPDSDEPHHPYNSFRGDNGFKDNLSAIRHLLYEKGLFGYVPKRTITTTKRPRTRTVRPTINVTQTTPKEDTLKEIIAGAKLRANDYDNEDNHNFYPRAKLKDPNQNGIAVDYYFGNEAERKSKSKIRFGLQRAILKNNDTETVKPKVTNEDIKMIMDMTHPADLLPTLDKLLSIKRCGDDLEPYLRVMGEMVKNDDKALNQYDWLGTAVEVRSAVKKLGDLSQQLKSDYVIHPADKQLLKYIMYLHKSTKKSLTRSALAEDMGPFISSYIMKSGRLPRNKNHHHKAMLASKGLMHRVWLRVMGLAETGSSDFGDDIREFDKFLNDLESGLYSLHDAIKHIALITRYNNQRWYFNLKELYLARASRKDLLSLLLHMSTATLVSLIEESATKGLEDDYLTYIAQNVGHVRKTKEEFLFVLRILDEIDKYYDI